MSTKKNYTVSVYFDSIEIKVTALSKPEARKKALVKLGRISPFKLIKRSWSDNRREIFVEEQ